MFNGNDMTLRLIDLHQVNVKPYKSNNSYQSYENKSQMLCNLPDDLGKLIPNKVVRKKETSLHQGQKPTLQRLTINVANTCNMACKYCYANKGTYYTKGIMMNKKTALNAINFISRNFSRVERINFFGGEPTLNHSIIELICEYFIYLYNRGVLSYLPVFGITTNGYNISKNILDLFQKYNFNVCISLDGPKHIHDKLRVTKNGESTYDIIEMNIKRLIERGINLEFECTYTGEHWQNGIDIVALMDFFYDNFKCNTLHCPMVITNPKSSLFIPIKLATTLYSNAIRYSISNLLKGIPKSISIAKRFMDSLITKIPIQQYCPAGRSLLTVNADGIIYSCFMLMGGKEYSLGNVLGKNYNIRDPRLINTLIRKANKWRNPVCRKCWAQTLCFGCLGEDISREGSSIHRSIESRRVLTCDFKRHLVETFLKSIVEIYLNSY